MNPGAIAAVVEGRHGDPFAILGPHGTEIRAFLPGADAVAVLDRATGARLGALDQVHPGGFWCGTVPHPVQYRLEVQTHGTTYTADDPYSFPPTLGDLDLHLLTEGRHRDLGRVLGAHPAECQGVAGVRFAVWAPNASRVSVVGGFNYWDPRRHPMRRHHGAGVWDIFIPGVGVGAIYKYDLLGPGGEALPQGVPEPRPRAARRSRHLVISFVRHRSSSGKSLGWFLRVAVVSGGRWVNDRRRENGAKE